jgi:hypothetical protein
VRQLHDVLITCDGVVVGMLVVTGDGVVVGTGVVVGVPLTVVGLGDVIGMSVYVVDGIVVGTCVAVVFVVQTRGVDRAAAGVIGGKTATLADADGDGEADMEDESEGSATLEAPVLLPDVWACDVIVDTDAADDFGDPPLVIM